MTNTEGYQHSFLEGRTEFQIFRNFYDRMCLSEELISMHTGPRKKKDNKKSEEFLQAGIVHCRKKEYEDGIYEFTKSLRYASYKSEQYGLALMHRAEIYLTLKNYQGCIVDINLCLEVRCSIELTIKSYLLKARCLFMLGKQTQMQHAIDAGFRTLASFSNLPSSISIKSVLDRYKKKVDLFLDEIALEFVKPRRFVNGFKRCPNVDIADNSDCLKYKHSSSKFKVCANRRIQRGETVFQEKAYAIALNDDHPMKRERHFIKYHCSYCLIKSDNCIPCKNCVHVLYCSEKCRNISWIDYHQWECNLMPPKMSKMKYWLPFRIVLHSIRNKKKMIGKKSEYFNLLRNNIDSKTNLHNFRANIQKMKKNNEERLFECASAAVLLVLLLENNTKFFHYLKTTFYQFKSNEEIIYSVGGLLLKQNIQAMKKLLIVNSVDFSNLDSNCTSISIATAICPSISQIPHSCIPNICEIFIGDVCIAKATRDIEEGEPIFRAHMGITYFKHSNEERKMLLKGRSIKCLCRACSNISCSKEILNSIPCLYCCGNSIETMQSRLPFFSCMDCGKKTLLCRELQQRFQFCKEFSQTAAELCTLDAVIKSVLACHDILNPFHTLVEQNYKLLVKLRVEAGQISLILGAIELFLECSYKRYDNSYYHGLNVVFLCMLLSSFIQSRQDFQHHNEFVQIVNRWTELLLEAREIMAVYLPRWLDYLDSELMHISNIRLQFSVQFYRSK